MGQSVQFFLQKTGIRVVQSRESIGLVNRSDREVRAEAAAGGQCCSPPGRRRGGDRRQQANAIMHVLE